MMRKNYLFAATAAIAVLTLTACSEDSFTQDDLVKAAEEQAGDAISFGTYLGTAGTTRAGATGAIADNTALQGASFGVFAYQTGTTDWSFVDADDRKANFMYNQKVTYSAPSWTYSPVKYWPNGKDAANPAESPSNTANESAVQKLSFFAYAPYVYVSTSGTKNGKEMQNNSGTSAEYDKLTDNSQAGTNGVGITAITANNTTGNPVISYSLPAIGTTAPTATNSVDLLWGLRGQASYMETDGTASTGTVGKSYNVDLTKQTVDERVKFLFKHALAKIGGKNGLKVVADFDGNGAGLGGFGAKSSETLITVEEVTIKDALNGSNSTFIQSGEFDISTGSWSGQTRSTNTEKSNLAHIEKGDINVDIAENFESSYPQYSSPNWKRDSENNLGGVTTTAKEVYKDAADALFMIPGPGQTLEVTVKYVVRTYDPNLDAKVASNDEGTWTKVTQTITNNVTLPTLEVNKYYTLVMHLGLTSVKFSAEVSNWDSEATESEVWLPSNVVGISLAAGESATVNVPSATTSYNITVTGCAASGNVTLTKEGEATLPSEPVTADAEGKAVVTVTLPANADTEYTKSSTITIKGKKTDDSDFTTTVTIIQAKAEAVTP